MMSLLYFNWCILLVFKNIVIYVTSKFSLFWLSRSVGRSVGPSVGRCSGCHAVSVGRSVAVC